MDWVAYFLMIVGGVLVMMFGGVPIAFSFLIVSILGVLVLQGGGAAYEQLIISMIGSVGTFALVPIPLFVLMGSVLWRSNLGRQAVDALDRLMGRMPGRLALLTLASGGVFSALSGSTMANTAMLGKMLLPEMLRRHYSKDVSMGTIMAAGGLAMMIPPSALAVILASIAKLSVAKVLLAAIVPGLLMGGAYAAYVIVRSVLSTKAAPVYEYTPASWRDTFVGLIRDLMPLSLIMGAVTGLILVGIATPTEAAAIGALASIILAFGYGRLSARVLKLALYDTLKITVMTFAILAGAQSFTQILAYSGATSGFLAAALSIDIPPVAIVIGTQIIVLILGCFMDQVAIMLITLPFFMPVILSMGYDPIWFAILMLINLETALMTPPLGLLLVVMKGVAPKSTTMGDIYAAAVPFVVINMLVVMLLIAFPQIVTTFLAAP
jgi:tripartite ATP-independent transporter DctM subunit